jgi:hypothetical protein
VQSVSWFVVLSIVLLVPVDLGITQIKRCNALAVNQVTTEPANTNTAQGSRLVYCFMHGGESRARASVQALCMLPQRSCECVRA